MKVLYPASHTITELDEAKLAVKIARHSTCGACTSCPGLHPPLGVDVVLDTDAGDDIDRMISSYAIDSDDEGGSQYMDLCACGHGIISHGADKNTLGSEEFARRGRAAVRLDELLQDVNRLLDFDYTNEDIVSLRKQMSLPDSPGKREKPPLSPASSTRSEFPAGPVTKRRRITLPEDDDDDDDKPLASSNSRPPNGIAAKTSGRTNAKGKNAQAQTGPVSLPVPTERELEEMQSPTVNGTHGRDPVVKVEDTMDEGQLDKLVTGVTVDASAAGSSGASGKPEKPSAIELRRGVIKIMPVENDGQPTNMVLLANLKVLFQKQLPVMPREYITRLVFDPNQRCVAIVKSGLKVVGGICYRPFPHRGFAEIVFFATHSVDQVKGYGGMLMDHFKTHVKATWPNMLHFLTYADNYAVGYFKKQGFTRDITLDRTVWAGYIKDYEGGTIMQCTMLPKVDYLRTKELVAQQRDAVLDKIREISKSHIVYPGLPQFQGPGEDFKPVLPQDVPGLRESGWTPDMDAPRARRAPQSPEYASMQKLLADMQGHSQAWPFLEPVNPEVVPDYYEIIKNPMDFRTMEEKLSSNQYETMEMFIADAQLVFDNCLSFNPPGTAYHTSASKMAKWFKAQIANRPKKEET